MMTKEQASVSKKSVAKPDERRRWEILAALFVMGMVLFGAGVLDFGVFFDPMRKTFLWSNEQTSSLLMALLLTSAVVSPLVGWLLDRFQPQLLMIFGAVLVAVAFVLAAGAGSFSMMMTAYLMLGVGFTCATVVPSQVLIAQWFEPQLHAIAFEIVIGSGMALGGIVIVPVTAALVEVWGWRKAYMSLAAVVILVVLPLVALVVRGRRRGARGTEKVWDAPGATIAEGFMKGSLWFLMLSYLAYGFAQGVPIAHLIPLLIMLGFTPQAAAANVAEYHVVAFFASLLMGFFGDRVGGRPASVLCFIMLAISLAAVLDARDTLMRVVFIVCFGFGVAAPGGLLAQLLAQTVGLRSFGFFSGVCSFLLTLGFAAGPLVSGWIMDVTGHFQHAFWLGGVLALLAAGTTLCVSAPKEHAIEAVALRTSE